MCLEYGNRVGITDCSVPDESVLEAVAAEFGRPQCPDKRSQYESRVEEHLHSYELPLQKQQGHSRNQSTSHEDS